MKFHLRSDDDTFSQIFRHILAYSANFRVMDFLM